ncbi:MAG: TerB family tellurite resistance protein [Myxococcales bacterium]|nr:TerB family tellurite resistance protein [Myxococcales bacterium]
MLSTNYDILFPLIAQATPDGATMRVTFRCPVTGTTVEAYATMQASDGVGSRAKAGVKRGLMWSLRGAVASAARQAVGGGMAGSMASGAAYGATSNVGSSTSFSEEQKKAAMVEAFESVRGQFAWDAANNRFISVQAASEVMTEFARQLEAAPVTTPYDRTVLARMLTEIACADGELGAEERTFLASFITADIGSIDQLSQQAMQNRLGAADLSECAQGPSRETMLMLGWALAFTDQELAFAEEQRLGELATGLSLDPTRAQQLKTFAQVYAVDNMLSHVYQTGKRDDATYSWVMDFADRIGLEKTEAERADIRYRKRYGLV